MIPFVCVFAVLVVPAYLASNSNSYYYGSSHMFGEETKMGSDIKKVEAVFGESDTYVLLVPKGNTSVEKELSNELHTVPQVTSIISYVDMAGAEDEVGYVVEGEGDWGEPVGFAVKGDRVTYVGPDYLEAMENPY